MVQVGKTYKEQVKLCAKILERVNGRLLGSVLNMAPRRGIGAVVYGYGFGYEAYAQKYYYTEDGNRKKVGKGASKAKRSSSKYTPGLQRRARATLVTSVVAP